MDQINFIGLWTLYLKEVRRFFKVYNQTLLAPVTTALLFLAIFNLAMGKNAPNVGSVPFGAFMASGLIMMSVMQQSFANTSSSFIMGKVLGTLIDYLMAPLSAGEITLGMVMAGVTRGIVVGLLTGIAVSFFVQISVYSWAVLIFYIISASMLMSLLGMFTGIFAETFDQAAAITSYIVTPLSFLSGTFYSVANLPPFWHAVSHYNPFFYMIDGFRYGITGYSDGSLTIGIYTIIITNIVLWIIVHNLLAKGYRIKS
jgi:ABC-2 type transport system permease protein